MEIIPDPIFAALQTLPFLVTVVALHFILFKPLLAYLEERQAASQNARKEASELKESTASRLEEMAARMAEARASAAAIRADRRADALAREAELVAAARKQAESQVAEALIGINAEREAAAQSIRAAGKLLSAEVAGTVLGRQLAQEGSA